MNKSFSKLTEEEILELSINELLELDLIESVGKIKERNRKYKSSLNHMVLQFVLFLISLFLNSFSLSFVLMTVIGITGIVVKHFHNNLNTSKLSLLMTLDFYKNNGIIHSLNEYLVEKNLMKLQE